jgi:hypothetical protein
LIIRGKLRNPIFGNIFKGFKKMELIDFEIDLFISFIKVVVLLGAP